MTMPLLKKMVIIDSTSARWLIELPCIALWQLISVVNLAISVITREGTSSETLSTMGWSVGIHGRGFNWINWDYKTCTKCGQYSCMSWALAWIKRRKGAEHTLSLLSPSWPWKLFYQLSGATAIILPGNGETSHNPSSLKLILSDNFITVVRKKRQAPSSVFLKIMEITE